MIRSILRQQAEDLAARWSAQARVFLLSGKEAAPEPVAHARTLVDALVTNFGDDAVSEDGIGYGMRFGAIAFENDVSLHHVMKALDLLAAMTLYVVESALNDDSQPGLSAADGLRLARRLQRRAALLSLSVTRGYMQAYAEALRERFRHLRHDLRNPLGTIKSVLALMDDESVPLEARVNPSFRAMAARNARSLEALIADRLSDVAALLPVVAGHDVSVRAIACGVRRELRDEADRRGVSILVEDGGSRGRLDAAGLELLLRGTLQAALQECEAGARLHIEFEQTPGRAGVVISRNADRRAIHDSAAVARLETLARQIGATITTGERVIVSVPLRVGDDTTATPEQERALPRETAELSDREAGHDLRGPREGHHGQAGAH